MCKTWTKYHTEILTQFQCLNITHCISTQTSNAEIFPKKHERLNITQNISAQVLPKVQASKYYLKYKRQKITKITSA